MPLSVDANSIVTESCQLTDQLAPLAIVKHLFFFHFQDFRAPFWCVAGVSPTNCNLEPNPAPLMLMGVELRGTVPSSVI